MQRTIFMMRHGHAPMTSPDHARELDALGFAQARNIGEQFALLQLELDLVLVSDAVRTQQTWEQFKQGAGVKSAHQIEPKLYHASLQEALEIIAQFADDKHAVMLVGHNPTCELLLHYLCKQLLPVQPAELFALTTQARSWQEAVQKKPFEIAWQLKPNP